MRENKRSVLRWLSPLRHSLPFDNFLLEMNYSAYLYSAVIKLLVKEIKLYKFLWLKRLHVNNLLGTAFFTQIYKHRICHAWTCEFSDLLTERRCINMSIYSHFGAL